MQARIVMDLGSAWKFMGCCVCKNGYFLGCEFIWKFEYERKWKCECKYVYYSRCDCWWRYDFCFYVTFTPADDMSTATSTGRSADENGDVEGSVSVAMSLDVSTSVSTILSTSVSTTVRSTGSTGVSTGMGTGLSAGVGKVSDSSVSSGGATIASTTTGAGTSENENVDFREKFKANLRVRASSGVNNVEHTGVHVVLRAAVGVDESLDDSAAVNADVGLNAGVSAGVSAKVALRESALVGVRVSVKVDITVVARICVCVSVGAFGSLSPSVIVSIGVSLSEIGSVGFRLSVSMNFSVCMSDSVCIKVSASMVEVLVRDVLIRTVSAMGTGSLVGLSMSGSLKKDAPCMHHYWKKNGTADSKLKAEVVMFGHMRRVMSYSSPFGSDRRSEPVCNSFLIDYGNKRRLNGSRKNSN